MKAHRHSRGFAARHRGAALVVSLLLLLVMTLLGLGASQSTRLQERMAGNQRDQEIALQGAEASLRAGEMVLSPTRPGTLITCRSPAEYCEAYQMRSLVDEEELALDLARQADEWWGEWGTTYANAGQLENVALPPEYILERFAEVREVLSVGDSNPDTVRDFYRATARSTGQTDTAQVVIQSTYARISFE